MTEETAVADGTLTGSGLGTVVPSPPGEPIEDLARRSRQAALTSGVALTRGLDLAEEDFQRLVHLLGQTVDHRFGEGRADLLLLNASRDEGKVVTGRGPLPLHTDGLLVGEQVDLIVLYARDFADQPGSGETTVCDQLAAWREMPAHLGAAALTAACPVTEAAVLPPLPGAGDALVVATAAAGRPDEDVRAAISAVLADLGVEAGIELAAAIPHTAVGKVDKPALRGLRTPCDQVV